RAGLAAMVPTGLAAAALFAVRAPYFDSVLGLSNVATVVAAWLVGLGVAHGSGLAARARERRRALPRESEEETRRRVVAERLRLAPVLHTRGSTTLAEGTAAADRAAAAAGAQAGAEDD